MAGNLSDELRRDGHHRRPRPLFSGPRRDQDRRELDGGIATSFQGNYTAYSEKKAIIRAGVLKAYLNQQQEIRHQEEVITKLKSFNREKSIKRAESREKMLSKMDLLENQPKSTTRCTLHWNRASPAEMTFSPSVSLPRVSMA